MMGLIKLISFALKQFFINAIPSHITLIEYVPMLRYGPNATCQHILLPCMKFTYLILQNSQIIIFMHGVKRSAFALAFSLFDPLMKNELITGCCCSRHIYMSVQGLRGFGWFVFHRDYTANRPLSPSKVNSRYPLVRLLSALALAIRFPYHYPSEWFVGCFPLLVPLHKTCPPFSKKSLLKRFTHLS